MNDATMANSGTITSPGARYTSSKMITTSTIVVNSVLSMLSAGGEEHVGADGRRAGHAQLQPLGETLFLPQALQRLKHPVDERDVVDLHELGAELQDDQHGLAVGTQSTDQAWPSTGSSQLQHGASPGTTRPGLA